MNGDYAIVANLLQKQRLRYNTQATSNSPSVETRIQAAEQTLIKLQALHKEFGETIEELTSLLEGWNG